MLESVIMDTKEAIKRMMESKRYSARALSMAIGKDPNAVSTMFSRNSNTNVVTLAKMADALGYKLQLTDGNETLTIDPPERNQ